MDENKIIKCFLLIISGWFTSFLNLYGTLSLLVCCAIVLDIITGLLKAKSLKKVNSSIGFKGFWKKLSLLAGLCFGYFLDFFEHYLISVSDIIDYSFHIPFGTIIGIYIILNESISILENLYSCGVKLPRFLIKVFKSVSDQADKDDM